MFDVKYEQDGKTIKKLRARFVAKGFTQKEGVDFYETFSPTAKLKTLKILLTILASDDRMIAEQWDVSAAYLHADLDCSIYMEQPEGFEVDGKEDNVIKLDKALFGLKQSGRLWNTHLTKVLKDMNFKQSRLDECLFKLEEGEEKMYILTHVDDVMVISTSETLKNDIFEKMRSKLKIRNEGDLKHFLGIHIERKKGMISVDQTHYIEELSKRFGLDPDSCGGGKCPIKHE